MSLCCQPRCWWLHCSVGCRFSIKCSSLVKACRERSVHAAIALWPGGGCAQTRRCALSGRRGCERQSSRTLSAASGVGQRSHALFLKGQSSTAGRQGLQRGLCRRNTCRGLRRAHPHPQGQRCRTSRCKAYPKGKFGLGLVTLKLGLDSQPCA